METGGTEWEDYFNGKDPKKTPADWGKITYERVGCNSCHTVDGSKSKGPSWKGVYGEMVKLNNGTSVLADENYLRESMMNPQAKVVQGFDPIMPTFQGLLKPNQVNGLVAYIESLK
jgi:cytochrome c oxidase subunit 2